MKKNNDNNSKENEYKAIPYNFFIEETRNGFTVTKKRKKMWAIELEMLNELKRVCKKYNLTFYADSGTLLGAIREKGFIPWDDDIDIVMFRKDYDKLLKVGVEEIKKPFFLQCAYSDIDYYRGHAQMRFDGTAAILKHEANKVAFHQGIFLDIFPLDYTDETEKRKRAKCDRLKKYKQLFNVWTSGVRAYNQRCLLSKIKLLLCNVIGKKRIYKHYEKKCRNTKSNKKTVDKVSYYWDYENYKNLNEEYFGDPVYMPFEFTEIPVPREYDTILKKYYGDNYLCPQIKQSGHQLTSGDMIIDTERSYQDILNQMNK